MAAYRIPALSLFDTDSSPVRDVSPVFVRFEEEIKRSRFITTLAHADSRLPLSSPYAGSFPTPHITAGRMRRGRPETRPAWGRATMENRTARLAAPC